LPLQILEVKINVVLYGGVFMNFVVKSAYNW